MRLKAPFKSLRDESGVALFMVISAMTVLTVLATEFTYVAQVNARMAIDSVDQIKAHYLAKTGLKLSLLRLRAYKQLKSMSKKSNNSNAGANSGASASGFSIPQEMLDQIWSFPFVYPIPTELPGLTLSQKDEIKKFESESTLQGRFSATIESQSNKLNLNTNLKRVVTHVTQAITLVTTLTLRPVIIQQTRHHPPVHL